MSAAGGDAGVSAAGERFGLYGLVVVEAASALVRAVRRAWARATAFSTRAPDRLLVAPQDLRTADPTVAADVYAGYFAFSGRLVETRGRSPFALVPPSESWAEALCGFGWLRHLRAADTAIARANARALVDDFLTHGGDRRGTGAEPRVVARRTISFLTQAPLILDGADHDFYSRFMRALGRAIARMRRAIAAGLAGPDRLAVSIALAYAGLCLSGPQRLQARADALLAETLADQILPDGSHISRNPQVLVDILTDLLPLRQTYAARGLEPPIAVLTAIDRMMPMLRLFRHDDGALALFNGMGLSAPDLLATLLAYDDARGRPMEHAPYSGYARLEAKRALVVADVGPAPPLVFSREAHAGCLSFEFSAAFCQIVVNCGVPRPGTDAAVLAARSTAAHSTATVNDASSCHFAGPGTSDSLSERLGRWLGPCVLSGPRRVETQRRLDGEDLVLTASHDGYVGRFGVIHERQWRLSGSGEALSGRDTFRRTGRGGEPLDAAIRFHLHPSVKASRSQGGHSVMLLLPDGEAWSFEAESISGGVSEGVPEDVSPVLDESVYFATVEGARRTEQIVVAVAVRGETEVSWRFTRLGRHKARRNGRPADPADTLL